MHQFNEQLQNHNIKVVSSFQVYNPMKFATHRGLADQPRVQDLESKY